MRAFFIFAGTYLINTFHWIIFVFGGFLVFSGVRMLMGEEIEVHPESNHVVKLFRRFVPMTSGYRGHDFSAREEGKWMATPLLLVLMVINVMDLVFAVDSIPAVFAITRDPFIVYTSNIFAILGLRALYFLLAAAMTQFRYLSVGLGAVLSFVGLKMVLSYWFEIPLGVSLAIVGGVLASAVLASIVHPKPMEPAE